MPKSEWKLSLPMIKRELLHNTNQNIIDARIEGNELILYTEPYSRAPQDSITALISPDGKRTVVTSKELNDLSRESRDNWSILKRKAVENDNFELLKLMEEIEQRTGRPS